MTDLSPVTMMLASTLIECSDDDGTDVSRLAQTVTAHFLDREKVKAALLAVLDEEFGLTDIEGVYPGLPNDTHEFGVGSCETEVSFDIRPMVDRLIAALREGGQS